MLYTILEQPDADRLVSFSTRTYISKDNNFDPDMALNLREEYLKKPAVPTLV